AERARDAAQVAATVAKRLADAKEHDEGDLKSARAMEGRRRDAADQLQRAQAQLKRAKEAVTAAGHVAEARRVRDAGKETLERCEDEATAAKSALDETEGRLSRTQAIILAEKLVASEPCPVCGSHDHPAPAQGAIEQSGLTDTFRSAERAYAKAAKAAVSAATELAKAEGVLTVRIEAAARVEPSEGTVEALELEVESASAALDELGEPVDIQALEAQLDALTGSLKEAESERDRLRAKVTKAQGAEVEARALHAAAIAEVPAELRDRTSLDAETARVSRDLRSLVDAMSRARDAEDKAREIAIGATTDAAAATSRVEEVAKRRDEAGRAFLTRLASQGLDRAVYDEHKPLFDRIEADFKQVTDHRDRLIEAETRRRDASEAIKGLEQPDLPPLTLAVEEAGEALELALKEAADAQARSKDLARLQQSIEDTYRELETLEAETGPLRELAQRMDGKNEVKLDLETFAIGAMFDRVLAAANLRLQPMTQGRYRLERAFESGGRGRRGLEIQAHDINTGKSRPTSTLSGGETFIAALALALGLADVVESLNGKVRMDTIFIDEGFGSLDTENGAGTLDQVLQVLGTLVSNNRAVGLISHVSLVQEAIPNGFYVRHGPAGSHVEERGGF
ncbi:MAG: hypothetical protein KDK53_22580, partial [Maritimibacter sp.]|nr:hypothetical protein [Maritimibacter sp.]